MVRTDGGRAGGWAGGRCTVTWLPNFLGWVDYVSYGATSTRALCAREELRYNNSKYKPKFILCADTYKCGDILWWLWHQQSNLHTDCIQHEDLDHGFLWRPAKEDKMYIVSKIDSMKNISSFSYSLSFVYARRVSFFRAHKKLLFSIKLACLMHVHTS